MNLRVTRLTRRFGERSVLDRVDLCVAGGESVAIVGPSGSGKSTLLNVIGSLDTPDDGSIDLDGVEVTELRGTKQERYRRESVGFVFQEHLLLPHLSALENVLLPTLGQSGGAHLARAVDLLARLGMAARQRDYPSTLSGGERQRVALARALIHSPKLLLADEPTGSLDEASGHALIDLLLGEVRGKERGLLMVTHNRELAARLDRVLSLRDGVLSDSAL